MSVLDRFEKSVEGAVNGVFAKFGSKDLQPVDLSSALEREIDAEAGESEEHHRLRPVDARRVEGQRAKDHGRRQADDDAHHGQNDIFTEHIRAGFPGMEAEHLDGRQLSDYFLNNDVGLFQSRS